MKAIELGIASENLFPIARVLDFCVESLCATKRTLEAKRLVEKCRSLSGENTHPGYKVTIAQSEHVIDRFVGDWDKIESFHANTPDHGRFIELREWQKSSTAFRLGESNEKLLKSLVPSFSKWQPDACHIATDIASTWLQVKPNTTMLRLCKKILSEAESLPRPTIEGDVRRAALRVLVDLAEGTKPQGSDIDTIAASPGLNIPRSAVLGDRILAMVSISEQNYAQARKFIGASITNSREAGFLPSLAWSLFDLVNLAERTNELVPIEEAERAAEECEALCSELEMPALARLVRLAISHLRTPAVDVRPGGLSEREVEVLLLIAEGKSNPDIAEALFISRHTVVRHVTNIYGKIDCSSRAEAASYAIANGLTASAS